MPQTTVRRPGNAGGSSEGGKGDVPKAIMAVGDTKHAVSYLSQNDPETLLMTETVLETLMFSALMRTSNSSRKQEQAKERVYQLVNYLKLVHVAHSQVGRLSGGERRRVALGVELVTNPTVLLCDEVTSALDSKSCEVVLELLRRYCDQGHCTVVTIHQPSTRLLCQFDAIVLISPGGSQLYFGPSEAAGYGVARVGRIMNSAHDLYKQEFVGHEEPDAYESMSSPGDDGDGDDDDTIDEESESSPRRPLRRPGSESEPPANRARSMSKQEDEIQKQLAAKSGLGGNSLAKFTAAEMLLELSVMAPADATSKAFEETAAAAAERGSGEGNRAASWSSSSITEAMDFAASSESPKRDPNESSSTVWRAGSVTGERWRHAVRLAVACDGKDQGAGSATDSREGGGKRRGRGSSKLAEADFAGHGHASMLANVDEIIGDMKIAGSAFDRMLSALPSALGGEGNGHGDLPAGLLVCASPDQLDLGRMSTNDFNSSLQRQEKDRGSKNGMGEPLLHGHDRQEEQRLFSSGGVREKFGRLLSGNSDLADGVGGEGAGFNARFVMLCARSCRQWLRDPSLLLAQMGLVILMSALIGTFAHGMPHDFTGSQVCRRIRPTTRSALHTRARNTALSPHPPTTQQSRNTTQPPLPQTHQPTTKSTTSRSHHVFFLAVFRRAFSCSISSCCSSPCWA
jgi:ABC-type multidrug transport system ATPase subunit